MTKASIWPGLILLMLIGKVKAQSPEDTAFYHLAINNAIKVHTHASRAQAPFLTGPLYRGYPFNIAEGHPYFNIRVPESGTIWYDGVRYDSVKLLYDEISDELLTEDFFQRNLILLPRKSVQQFAIGSDHFVYLDNISGREPFKPGYFQVLYDGKTKVFRKEIKKIQEKANPVQEVERVIESNAYYYMLVNDGYHLFTGIRGFMSLFKEHKKPVRDHLKQNGFEYRELSAATIRAAASYYDQLSK